MIKDIGNLPGYGHQKQWYKLIENYDIYLNAKNQIHPSLF